jgi:hypothetical protein
MYTIYNGYWPPNTGGSHNINTESNVNTAWTEGWADFFPLASQNDSYFTYLGHYNIDLETPTGYWEDGDKVEGRVAGALWDIFDSANDGYDTFSDGFVNIWDTISNQVDDTYHEFYESWVSRGHDQCGFLLTAYQNTIDYNDPPTCTITLPNGGGWYSGTITITASASDDDGLVEKVEFQYSQDHGNWYDIGTDTSPSGGWSINWNTESITDSSVWVRARAYDGMEWSGWDESDSSFGIDNTPPYPPIVTEHHCGGSHSGWPAWTMHTSPYFTWSNPGDEGSGIDHCEVQVNDGEWSTVSSGWHPTYGSGEYRFDFRAIDGVDLASDEYRIYVRIDVMPPITTHSLSGTEGNNNWWKSNVGVTLSASDEHSGVDYTKYRIDGGAWNTGNTFTVSGNGIHTVEYYSVDNAGNEEEHHSVVIKIETTTTPPTTTHSLSGTMGENGWYVSNVVVTLTATDDVSGVDYTKYRIDSGSWQTYSAPFTVSTNGEHTVDYYSVDNVGNEESQKSVSFKIDKTPPTATITRPKEGYLYFLDIEIGPTPNGNTIIVGRITIKADASDETSGIDKVEFYINDELKYTDEGAPYEWEWHPGISFNPTIKVVAYDEAGNSNSDSMVVYAYTEEDWEGQ